MREQVYDPTKKRMIKDTLYAYLYQPTEAALQKKLHHIITRNTLLIGNGQDSFFYRGEIYRLDPSKPLPRPVNQLHPSLKPEMDAYLQELHELNNYELPYVLGYITHVLNASNSLQDYYRLLPESVHAPLRAIEAACACRNRQLPDQAVQDLRIQHTRSIELMKQRMAKNLLLT